MATKTYVVDLNHVALDPDDSPLKIAGENPELTITLGKLVSNAMSQLPAAESILKLYDWMKALRKGEALRLDHEDFLLLKETIRTMKFSLLIAGQILSRLAIAQDKAEKGESDG